MKALTLTQPWAGVIASGIKLVENRPRNMAPRSLFGQRFALHASRRVDEDVLRHLVGAGIAMVPSLHLQTSAIIGVATLDRVITEPSSLPADQLRWFFGPFGFVLSDVQVLRKPIVDVKGALGFWEVPNDIAMTIIEETWTP